MVRKKPSTNIEKKPRVGVRGGGAFSTLREEVEEGKI